MRLVVPVFALLLAAVALAGEPTLPELRRQVLEASSPDAVGRALDLIQARVGREQALPTLSALGDWLGELPDGRARHPVVLARRGWAYVSSKRGAEAVPLLEQALEDDPSKGFVRAYLGEALRQADRGAEALAMLATAVKAGYDAPHVHESALGCVLGLRLSKSAQTAAGLPEYARAAAPYLLVVDDLALHAALARALLDDLAAYDAPASERGRAWARAASEHAHHALAREGEAQGGARLALDAAIALAPLDQAEGGRTLRFDLLALAYVRGKPLDREGHDLPEALPLLAEAALLEGRYELAARLARERLELSESPAARRVLLQLPPDLGD
jgi:hypothetical protein